MEGFTKTGCGCSCSPLSITSAGIPLSPSLLIIRNSPFLASYCRLPRKSTSATAVSVFRSSLPGSEVTENEVLQMFLKERQLNGDFISKVSDALWRKDALIFVDSEDSSQPQDFQQTDKVLEDENSGGFLKLTKTQQWISDDNVAPVNKKLTAKERQNDSEKMKLNLLKYGALKRELLLLTTVIGVSCSGYCLITLSFKASISYAAGVLLSCLYLQLLYYHADNLSMEAVPPIFLQKKIKKIGIRSEDLENLFERTVKGSAIALSSPRLVLPAAIYGLWALSHQFLNDFFDFQIETVSLERLAPVNGISTAAIIGFGCNSIGGTFNKPAGLQFHI